MLSINSKKKKYLIGALILILLIALIFCLTSVIKNNSRNTKLKEIATNYYDSDFSKTMPSFLKRNKELYIYLSTLKQLKKDISYFEKNNCNLDTSYVLLTYVNDSKYDVNSYLDCK